MALYSLTQISTMYDASITTTWRHIHQLKKKKLFKKTAVGKYYNEKDVRLLSELMSFKLELNKQKLKTR